MNTLCLHRPATPGDLWPPVCVEHAGHKGDHQSKPEFTSAGKLARTRWANEEPQLPGRSLWDRADA